MFEHFLNVVISCVTILKQHSWAINLTVCLSQDLFGDVMKHSLVHPILCPEHFAVHPPNTVVIDDGTKCQL